MPAELLFFFLRLYNYATDDVYAWLEEEISRPWRAAIKEPAWPFHVIIPWPGCPHHVYYGDQYSKEALTAKPPTAVEHFILTAAAEHRELWDTNQVGLDEIASHLKLTMPAKLVFQTLARCSLQANLFKSAAMLKQPTDPRPPISNPVQHNQADVDSMEMHSQASAFAPIHQLSKVIDFPPSPPDQPAVALIKAEPASEVSIGDTISSIGHGSISFVTDAADSNYIPVSESDSDTDRVMVDMGDLISDERLRLSTIRVARLMQSRCLDSDSGDSASSPTRRRSD